MVTINGIWSPSILSMGYGHHPWVMVTIFNVQIFISKMGDELYFLLTLVLPNLDSFFCKNTEDPDQLPPDEAI